jgi:hypothetical protein
MRQSLPLTGLLVGIFLLAGCLDLGGGGPGSSYPVYRSGPGYSWRSAPRYGWDRPSGRYVQSGDISCDRRTQVCYKRGHIDTSSTREVFGREAARDADAIRDELGTSHVYIPRNRNNSYCVSAEKTCYKNGRPDWSDTRDVYGKKAGRRLKSKQDDD